VGNKNKIGVMQGRLLPKFKGKYQAHPLGYWENEFQIAADLKLDCIEFILDFDDFEKNPLMSSVGIEKIQQITKLTGVKVSTICADYFMDAPLHSKNKKISENSLGILKLLLNNAKILGVSDVIIPCVDQSSLKQTDNLKCFVDKILPVIPVAERLGVNICLETDLPPDKFYNLIEKLSSNTITVNYDIGNSASLGFDIKEELQAYGDRISDVHIKDRELHGAPVFLGKGNANFPLVFQLLKEINYKGPYVMQAFRDDEGLMVFQKQFNWIKKYLY
tara:strand:- start:1287 stop:2114 length:828 start_codon:yes stop_codon:yes gene_type:complete